MQQQFLIGGQRRRWECCLDILKGYESANGFEYDFIIKSRPDVLAMGPVRAPGTAFRCLFTAFPLPSAACRTALPSAAFP